MHELEQHEVWWREIAGLAIQDYFSSRHLQLLGNLAPSSY